MVVYAKNGCFYKNVFCNIKQKNGLQIHKTKIEYLI